MNPAPVKQEIAKTAKTCKSFLIDPQHRFISPHDYDGDWRSIAPTIGCTTFDRVVLNEENDAVFVDDEGLFSGTPHFFAFIGIGQPFAGRGLVLGADEKGYSATPKAQLELLTAHLVFLELLTAKPLVWKLWRATQPNTPHIVSNDKLMQLLLPADPSEGDHQ